MRCFTASRKGSFTGSAVALIREGKLAAAAEEAGRGSRMMCDMLARAFTEAAISRRFPHALITMRYLLGSCARGSGASHLVALWVEGAENYRGARFWQRRHEVTYRWPIPPATITWRTLLTWPLAGRDRAEMKVKRWKPYFADYLLPRCNTFLGKVEAHAIYTPFLWRTFYKRRLTRDAIPLIGGHNARMNFRKGRR